MNLREEIGKAKKEENTLANEMLKFLNKEEISEESYNKIIDELQRCIDEKINLDQTSVYSEQAKK